MRILDGKFLRRCRPSAGTTCVAIKGENGGDGLHRGTSSARLLTRSDRQAGRIGGSGRRGLDRTVRRSGGKAGTTAHASVSIGDWCDHWIHSPLHLVTEHTLTLGRVDGIPATRL
jgi:hypothetical protein